MSDHLMVIHERLGQWARQLRPRLADQPVRVVETRSGDDLEAALRGSGIACPIVLIDLTRRVRDGLDDLDRALKAAPEALSLVIEPGEDEAVPWLARELGATHAITGSIPPPVVSDLLTRWLVLAQQRSERTGWFAPATTSTEPEPWNWLNPLLSLA